MSNDKDTPDEPGAERNFADLVSLGIDEQVATCVRCGPRDGAEALVEWLGAMVSVEKLRELIADPRNKGIHTDDEAEAERLVRQAALALVITPTAPTDYWFDDFMNHFFVRSYGGKPRVGHFENRSGRPLLPHERGDTIVWQSPDDFRNAHQEKFTTVTTPDGKRRKVPLAKAWLEAPPRSRGNPSGPKRYERAEFLPDQEAPPDVFNTWLGFPGKLGEADVQKKWADGSDPEFDDGDVEPEQCARFLDHMRENMCGGDDEKYYYLLTWMADLLQNPGHTSEVAIVLRGGQGTGKTFWATKVMDMVRPHTLLLDKPDALVGRFNSHLRDKLVVFADEAFFAGNRQHAATMKSAVTSTEFFAEPKGVDGRMERKLYRLIVASNNPHVVPADADDRRYFVLDVEARDHEKKDRREYFRAIAEEMDNGGLTALFRWLRGAGWRETLQEWNMDAVPKTSALREQQVMSLPPAYKIVHNMLATGEPGCDFKLHSDGTVFVPTQLLADERHLKEEHLTALGRALAAVAGSGARNVRHYVAGRQRRGYWLPRLELARRNWERFLGWSPEWPADVTDWAVEATPTPDDDFPI